MSNIIFAGVHSSFRHFTLLLRRTSLAYIAFFLCRLIFLVFNFRYFENYSFSEITQAFFAGLLFDTSAIIYLNSLFILLHLIPWHYRDYRWYQTALKILLMITTGIALLLNLVDTGYFPFSGKRTGMEIRGITADIPSHIGSYVADYWYLLVLLVGLVYFLYKTYPRYNAGRVHAYSVRQMATELLVLAVTGVTCFFGARGGWNLKPLNTFDAARFVRTELVPLALNTPFQFIMTVQQVGVTEKNYFDKQTVSALYNPIHQPAPGTNTAPKNIVLIIVESLGKEYVGYYNHGKGYTPFLDSLMRYSTVYAHAYANGKRSIEGIPAILASMPSWMDDDYLSSFYQSNRLKSIGAYLKETGYNSSFYHGGENGTMNLNNFVAITDGGKYYGLNEYPNRADHDGHWGIYDEPYLRYFATELSGRPQPFFSSLFTLSSHHPYSLPPQYANSFPAGTLPIHKTIAYTDYALKQFFVQASKTPWYNNTVFIITADHSSENETPYYQTSQGRYEIPLIIFDPALRQSHVKTNTAQQLDILSLAMQHAAYPKPWFSFGSAACAHDTDTCGFAIQYFDKIFQLIQWPFVYQFDGSTGTGFYNLRSDSLMNKNLIGEKETEYEKSRLDSLLKSVIQQYHHTLITNTTHVQ